MAFKGTAGKSASGASMSQYDVEVEARLKALEKGLAECKASCESHSHSGGGDGDLASQVAYIIDELETRFPSPRRTFRPPSA
tara:strand:- start:76 stop:321 length:246 start_codon:yes stop_codon:yes gene_type:complete